MAATANVATARVANVLKEAKASAAAEAEKEVAAKEAAECLPLTSMLATTLFNSKNYSYFCTRNRHEGMKTFAYIVGMTLILSACTGEDRSGEEPFPPTVRTHFANVAADACNFQGEVVASPNSNVTERGFYYGNDTLRVQLLAPLSDEPVFDATATDLKAGDYYVYAYATNGMGTTRGDTLTFSILP